MNTRTFQPSIYARIYEADRYICAVLLGLVALLYAPSLNIWLYGDDFSDILRALGPHRWDLLSAIGREFRPFERLIGAINVSLLGYKSMLVFHIASLLGFMISIVIVFRLARLLEPNCRNYAILASAFFAVSPTNVMSVTQTDTITQQYATVFSLLMLWWLLSQYHRKLIVYHSVAFLLAFLALCSKETSIGFVLAAPLAVYCLGWKVLTPTNPTRKQRTELWNLVVSYLGTIIVLLGYMVLRLIGGAAFNSFGDERYSLQFSPFMISVNMSRLLAGFIYNGSSLDVFPDLQVVRILPSVIFTLALLGMSGLGIKHIVKAPGHEKTNQDAPSSEVGLKSRQLTVAGLTLLVLAGTFPVNLLRHMSELYTYASSPFYALLLGLLVVQGLQVIRSLGLFKAYASRVVFAFLLTAIIWLAYGTGEKVRLALDVSNQAKNYFHKTESWLASVPDTDVTLCWRSDLARSETGAYSGFLMADRVILRGVVYFSSQLGSKHVNYIEEGSNVKPCDYEAFVDDNGLNIIYTRE